MDAMQAESRTEERHGVDPYRYGGGNELHQQRPETAPSFRDVLDHAIRVNDSVDYLRELLNSALEVNLLLASVDQSEVTKKLASWAAILAVPTAVAGIYGMNFQFMPELHSPYGYPAVMLVIFGVCGFLYWRFKRTRWL